MSSVPEELVLAHELISADVSKLTLDDMLPALYRSRQTDSWMIISASLVGAMLTLGATSSLTLWPVNVQPSIALP